MTAAKHGYWDPAEAKQRHEAARARERVADDDFDSEDLADEELYDREKERARAFVRCAHPTEFDRRCRSCGFVHPHVFRCQDWYSCAPCHQLACRVIANVYGAKARELVLAGTHTFHMLTIRPHRKVGRSLGADERDARSVIATLGRKRRSTKLRGGGGTSRLYVDSEVLLRVMVVWPHDVAELLEVLLEGKTPAGEMIDLATHRQVDRLAIRTMVPFVPAEQEQMHVLSCLPPSKMQWWGELRRLGGLKRNLPGPERKPPCPKCERRRPT